jgi:DNA primase
MKYDAYKIKSFISAHDFYLREQNLDRFRFISNQWAIAGLCPFHVDTKIGSFKINLKTGAFKCWSCGASGGDIISFLQKRDHTGFIETLDRLSREWRVY